MFSFFRNIKKSSDVVNKDVLEERLLEADVEYDIVEQILKSMGNKITKQNLQNILSSLLKQENCAFREINSKPLVYLIIGVNGAGKTTTIAKLGKLHKKNGKKVIFGAGDTFRAAAMEQLCSWGKKLDIQCVSSKFGADPAAVAFDTINAAQSRGSDIALIDTAGRLDNKTNLKNELIKISNTCKKALGHEDFYKILVLDGVQGVQAINQAKVFHETLGIDGIIITKMDGTSKGGSLISIMSDLRLPIMYVGIGESEEDLIAFDVDSYLSNVCDYIFGS